MAITDLQISDTLETGAPSIKYTGNEGPQPPTQTAEADPMLVEEYQKYVFEMQEQGLEPMSFEQFKAEAVSGMAEGGRARYGLGSFVRKLIPNEVAKIAEKAAPFVAPFNPIAGGLMGGLGSYDRTGNLMGSALRGLGTYGLGQGARYLGGAELQGNPFTQGLKMPGGASSGIGQYFSKPMGTQNTGFNKWFGGDKAPISELDETRLDKKVIASNQGDTTIKGKRIIEEGIDRGPGGIIETIKKLVDSNTKKIILGAMAGTGLYTALSQKGEIPFENIEEIARGEGMDIEGIRAEVQEALAGGEAAWNELKKKYPYIGQYGTKKVAEGGRIGLYAGGGVGYPPVTWGQQPAPAPQMPPPKPRPNPMPAPQPMAQPMAPQPNQKPMGGGMNPMAGGMNPMGGTQPNQKPMGGGMNPMAGGMNPMGGRRMAQEGGLMDLGGMEKDYRQEGGFVPLGGKEKADDVPARLSKNEFVFTADAVRNAGGGDIDKGAGIMERVMENLEQGGKISEETQGLGGAQEMFDVSERLSEVV